MPDQDFPPRAKPGVRRLLRSNLHHEPIHFPPLPIHDYDAVGAEQTSSIDSQIVEESVMKKETHMLQSIETPTTIPSDAQSDNMSTQPTTPSSAVVSAAKSQQTPTQPKSARSVVPVVPIIPAMPVSPVAFRKGHRDSITSTNTKATSETESAQAIDEVKQPESIEASSVPPPAPKSWAELVRKQAASAASAANVVSSAPMINGASTPKTETLGEVLGELSTVEAPSKVVFLEPRGLVNTGNMCYMNSVCHASCCVGILC